MIIQAFIPDWGSRLARSWSLKKSLEPFCETTILDSYDVPFSVQWEEAVSKFTGDIFLWAMADARLLMRSYEDLFAALVRAYSRGDIAMYAPNLDYTGVKYDTRKLRQVDLGLYEVAATDLIFASLHRDLLAALPPLGCNTHAWSYDYLATHIAHSKLGKKVVRDYNFLIDHPYGKAYSEPEAIAQQDEWMRGLSLEHMRGILVQQRIKREASA